MQDPIKILGVPVHAMTMQEAVKTLEERMLAKEQTFVVTANAEIIMMCQENAEYKKIICEDAELVLPDGAGAVWAGRHLGYKVPERVAGFDLYNELLDLSAHKGYKAYFFGGSPGVAEAAKAKAEELYPGVKVVGCHNGYFKDEDVPQIIADINASGADMLFVALGAPKQEKWMAAHQGKINGLMLGVGAGFDYYAENIKRAPMWMQKSNLEWLYRLMQDPKRLFKRYLNTNTKFIWNAMIRGK